MNKSALQRILTCFVFLLLIGGYTAKAQVSQAVANALQTKLDQVYITHGVKGISAAVYMPGRGTWKGVAGFSHSTVPIDTDMVFNMGSITKSFVAAEILKLAEQGLLSLSDSIKDYLPPHQYIDSTITIKQMLNHTSGLGEILGAAWQNSINTNPNKWWNPQATIDSFLPAPQALPGHVWAYCNSNYELLGMIIEHLKQDSLAHVLRTDFIDPLGLSQTYMHIRETSAYTVPHNWANTNMIPGQGYDASSFSQVASSTSSSAAGGLYTSAADLAHWGYSLYSGAVINPASLQQMTTFLSIGSGYFNGYGLGCMRLPYTNKIYYGHAGNFFGMAAALYYYPQDGTTLAVLVNEDCISPYIAREIMDDLLNTLLDVDDVKNDAHKLSVYPNPATDMVCLKVTSTQNTDAAVRISSITGKTVFTRNVKLNAGDNSIGIPVAELSNGMYFCEVQNNDGTQTEKLLIQK